MLDWQLPLTWLDAVLVFTGLEWAVLSWRRRITQRGLSVADISLGLLPGFMLMLAVRMAAPEAVPASVFLCLMLAGLAHGLDFWRRHHRAGLITNSAQ